MFHTSIKKVDWRIWSRGKWSYNIITPLMEVEKDGDFGEVDRTKRGQWQFEPINGSLFWC